MLLLISMHLTLLHLAESISMTSHLYQYRQMILTSTNHPLQNGRVEESMLIIGRLHLKCLM